MVAFLKLVTFVIATDAPKRLRFETSVAPRRAQKAIANGSPSNQLAVGYSALSLGYTARRHIDRCTQQLSNVALFLPKRFSVKCVSTSVPASTADLPRITARGK